MTGKLLAMSPPDGSDGAAWAAYLNTASRYVAIKEEQAHLAIYDPKVPAEQIHADLQPAEDSGGEIEICSDPYAAAKGAHAVAVLTEWDEFRDLDYERIYDSMLKPAVVFDGRNILDLEHLREIGFKAEGIGKG